MLEKRGNNFLGDYEDGEVAMALILGGFVAPESNGTRKKSKFFRLQKTYQSLGLTWPTTQA